MRKAVFVMLFGSYMGNWDGTDDLLRSVLATPTMGLACMMVGEPHWFVHHMGLGETIGYGTRLTMNNNTLYQSASNAFMRAVYINLMGDPTLRQDPICPPSGLFRLRRNKRRQSELESRLRSRPGLQCLHFHRSRRAFCAAQRFPDRGDKLYRCGATGHLLLHGARGKT